MTDHDVLEAMLSRIQVADTALHDGDPEPRIALWSRGDDVTVLGAAVSARGWEDCRATFEWVASRFADCSSFDFEVISSGVSGDLAYLIGLERTTASVGGEPPAPYSLRVTTLLRREGGEWRIFHRHADAVPGDAEALLAKLGAPSP